MTQLIKFLPITIIALLSTQCKSVKDIESSDVRNQESQIKRELIGSSYLNKAREVSIYLPTITSEDKNLAVVYATDGQEFVKEYKRELDSLIENNLIPKLIIVGVHSDERQIEGSDFSYRNYEYIKSLSLIHI